MRVWWRAAFFSGLIGAALVLLTVCMAQRQPSLVLEYSEVWRDERLKAVYYIDLERGIRVRELSPLAVIQIETDDTAPDGRRVVALPTPGNIDLFLTAPGVTRFQLTHFNEFPARRGGRDPRRANLYPMWSPDSQWVVFLSTDEVGHIDLYTVRPDGSDLHPLAAHTNSEGPLNPMWVELLPG